MNISPFTIPLADGYNDLPPMWVYDVVNGLIYTWFGAILVLGVLGVTFAIMGFRR